MKREHICPAGPAPERAGNYANGQYTNGNSHWLVSATLKERSDGQPVFILKERCEAARLEGWAAAFKTMKIVEAMRIEKG